MIRRKFAACIAAAMVTLAGATYLATPARAMTASPCTTWEGGYAQGYADNACGGSGTVAKCQDNGNGTFTFWYYC